MCVCVLISTHTNYRHYKYPIQMFPTLGTMKNILSLSFVFCSFSYRFSCYLFMLPICLFSASYGFFGLENGSLIDFLYFTPYMTIIIRLDIYLYYPSISTHKCKCIKRNIIYLGKLPLAKTIRNKITTKIEHL